MTDQPEMIDGRRISRKEALARGLTRFYTGKPCRKGHVAERLTSCNACYECKKSKNRRWAAENPEKIREKSRKYCSENRRKRNEMVAERFRKGTVALQILKRLGINI